VCVLAPARALPDELDLGLALPRHHRLEQIGERRDRASRRTAERRPPVAEDARIAVLVGSHRAGHAEVGEHAGEDRHRMLDPRVLGIRLDLLERRLGQHALDLELGDEREHVSSRTLGEDDGPLRGEEPEAGQVLDVVLIEDDVPAPPLAPDALEHPLAPPLELGDRDARSGMRALLGRSHDACDLT
jgi:hypothetical protein